MKIYSFTDRGKKVQVIVGPDGLFQAHPGADGAIGSYHTFAEAVRAINSATPSLNLPETKSLWSFKELRHDQS